MAMNVNALAGARPLRVRPGDPDAELVAAARSALNGD